MAFDAANSVCTTRIRASWSRSRIAALRFASRSHINTRYAFAIGHRERPYDLAHKRVVRIWRGAKLSSAIIPAGSRGAHAATGSIPYT